MPLTIGVKNDLFFPNLVSMNEIKFRNVDVEKIDTTDFEINNL